MNAVEAVERLTALGRRMQMRERQMQQPVAPLHASPVSEQAMADPLAALGALLAAAGSAAHPHPDPQAAAGRTQRSGAPVQGPFFTAAPPQPGGQTGKEPGAPLRQGPRWQGPRRQGPLQDAPSHPPTLSPDAGVRLVRRQASLLGILSANVDAAIEGGPGAAKRRDEGAATVAHEGMRATPFEGPRAQPVDGQGPRLHMSALDGREDATGAPLERPVRLPLPDSGAPVSFAQDTAGDDSGHPSGAPGAPATAQQGGAPRTAGLHAAGDEDISLGARMGMSVHATETRFLGPARFMPPSAGVRPFEADMAQNGRDRPDLRARYTPVPVDTPLDDDPWRGAAAGTGAEHPLSLAQIDQVLAALDEKLELMLLRMYGTSGGT